MPGDTAEDDWDAHWGDYASSATDNPAQAYRRRLVIEALSAAGTPERLVDIGSGQGDLLFELARVWPESELTGVEMSATGVASGAAKVPTARFIERNLLIAGEVPADRTAWATHAVCSEVLEHVDDPTLLLANAAAYLQPGCRVVITVPGGPRSAFDKHIGHRRHFTKQALRDVLVGAGYRVDEVCAAGFPAFNVYKLLVIVRGRRLIDDVKASGSESESRLSRAVMKAFNPIFRFVRRDSRWGWQLTAVATYPGAT